MSEKNQTECVNSVNNSANVKQVAYADMQNGRWGGNVLAYDDTFWNHRRALDEINHWTHEKMLLGIDIDYHLGDYSAA